GNSLGRELNRAHIRRVSINRSTGRYTAADLDRNAASAHGGHSPYPSSLIVITIGNAEPVVTLLQSQLRCAQQGVILNLFTGSQRVARKSDAPAIGSQWILMVAKPILRRRTIGSRPR